MQKCSKICKNLCHYAKRTEVCTCHDLNDVDEHQLSVQNVYFFFYSLDFDMEWQQWKPAAETTQPRKRDIRCSSLCWQWK